MRWRGPELRCGRPGAFDPQTDPLPSLLSGRAALDLHPVTQHAARDHQALDLRRALVDLHDARVAVVALDRVLLHVAVATVNLDRLMRDPGRGLARVELGHAGL